MFSFLDDLCAKLGKNNELIFEKEQFWDIQGDKYIYFVL